MSTKKILGISLAIAFIVSLFFLYPLGKDSLAVLSGYSAKSICSCVFVAERELQSALDQELSSYGSVIDAEVNDEKKMVKVSAAGVERIAVFREGLGCTLIPMGQESLPELKSFQAAALPLSDPDTLDWPMGDRDTLAFPADVDKQKLETALDNIFTESNPELLQNTRAALVVYKDKIIGERYAEGFDEDTRLRGWSMTKSVTNAFVGILAGQGKLRVDQQAPIPAWHGENDPRSEITIDHLMRMSSGLDFEEVYDGATDANRMLFLAESTADFAIQSKLAHKPDTHWSYSSGTSNILSKIVRDQFENHNDYLR
ncbi:MAG: serine hydrolase, partial [Bacteroidota bacterium]